MEQPAINEAGLLNSMSFEDLRVTCERLERSCEDMRSLLNEFVEEQAMLRREQDRLHKRVEKAQKKVGRQENFIDNLISDMEQLEVSNLLSSIFRAKEERKVAKRRRWATKEAAGQVKAADTEKDLQDEGPFSDHTVKFSWATELQGERLPSPELAGHGADALSRWVREVMSGDPVAEERLPDGWAQLAKRAAEASPQRASPGSSPTGPGFGFFDPNSPGGSRPVQRAQRPDFGPDGQDVLSSEENSHFDTLVGLVSNVAGHQVAQQMERGFEAAQQLAAQAQRAASKRMDRGEVPAPQSFSRRLQEASAAIASFSFTDWATGTGEGFVPEGEKPRLDPDHQVPGATSQVATDTVLDRKARRAKFQEEFSMYISKSTESPDRPRVARPPVSVAPPRAAASSEDEPPTPPPQPPSREAVLMALQSEDDEAADEAPEVCMVPYGLVAQVTSLNSGSVRLSWLFDWEAAPSDISEAQRGFEVLCCEADAEEVRRQSFERSPAQLELPPGTRCRLQVKAVLRTPDADANADALWTSSVSAAVSADLRSADRKATSSEPASPAPSNPASATPSSLSGVSAPSFAQPRLKGRVAANFTDFLKRTPPSSGPSAAKNNAKVVMGGSAPKVSLAPPGPLGSLQPRVVNAGAMDPNTEKRELAERIRLRSGPGGSNSLGHDDRPRSSSFDSDDESLAKLSQALSSLERTQQALQKPL